MTIQLDCETKTTLFLKDKQCDWLNDLNDDRLYSTPNSTLEVFFLFTLSTYYYYYYYYKYSIIVIGVEVCDVNCFISNLLLIYSKLSVFYFHHWFGHIPFVHCFRLIFISIPAIMILVILYLINTSHFYKRERITDNRSYLLISHSILYFILYIPYDIDFSTNNSPIQTMIHIVRTSENPCIVINTTRYRLKSNAKSTSLINTLFYS